MKQRLLSVLLFSALVLGITLTYDHSLARTGEPTYLLRYAENQSADYPTTQGGRYFASLVAERTHGDVQIYVYDSGTLGDEASVIRQVQFGGIELARISVAQMVEHSARMAVLTLPFLYRDETHFWNVLDGEIGDSFLGPIGDSGLIALSWYDAGARHFYTTDKRLASLDDLRGLTIRVQEAPYMEDMIRALGAVPKAMPYAMVYSSLSTGEVDGAENNWPSYLSMQHYRAAPYLLRDGHVRIPEMQIISEAAASELPPEYLEIIRECAQQSALYERELWQQQEAEAEQQAVLAGVQITELSTAERLRFQQACAPLYEKYAHPYMDIVNQIIETP